MTGRTKHENQEYDYDWTEWINDYDEEFPAYPTVGDDVVY